MEEPENLCGDGYVWDEVIQGCVPEDEYYEVLDSLSGKAECVYNKLKQLSGGFRNAIQKFDGDFPVSHLMFTLGDLGDYTRGQTLPPNII
ncbi:hypothetical protein ACG2LH_04435 [Zhouia sp. PK063]|uniref:hypothetical protein n=1 Tax=Zhouia sp. PK063 TaxID=3373602 RepID=UPI0037A6FF64